MDRGSLQTSSLASGRIARSISNTRLRRTSCGFVGILTRLHLEYKHEEDHHNLYREVPPDVWFEGDKLFKRILRPQLVYSGTDTSKLVDWVVGLYVPEVLRTGTVPPPTVEQQEWAAHRKAREAYKARPKLTRKQAVAKAMSKRW